VRRTVISADLTVVGGGLAGVCAAIAAARLGTRVSLITNRPVLGGNSSSEIRVWVCGATTHGAQKFARENGIIGEMILENQFRNPEGNPVLWDHVILDYVRREPNISLYLNTDVHTVQADGPPEHRSIIAVTGRQLGSESEFTFESPLFLDATGDGFVGDTAGARFMEGREARSDFGESWAPEAADGNLLGSTILFYVRDTGAPVRFVPPDSTISIAGTPIAATRTISPTRSGCFYWWIEWGGELDIVADNERIRDELWGVIFGIWDHIKNSGEYDAEDFTLEWVGTVPGKREYRRFIGDHVLIQQDIMAQTPFNDRVAFGGWPIDLHPPGGMYAGGSGAEHLFSWGLYHVPWRSLYSVNVENLLIAGRNISASHVAFGSTRVMATCAVIGQAAGTGAALALNLGVTPREVGTSHVSTLHRTLLREDAAVLGVLWDDPGDYALSATATASSTLDDLSDHEDSGDQETLMSLAATDLGLLIPVDPELASIRVLVELSAPSELAVELWSTARGENQVPVEHVTTTTIHAPAGRSWVEADFAHRPPTPENAVVVIRRNSALSVVVREGRGAYGVLGLLSRSPRSVDHTQGEVPPSNAWSAEELRRRHIPITVSPPTSAHRADKVIGGYARPFGGPQLWSSERIRNGAHEWIRLDWEQPQHIATVELVFNADVDEDLNNLHHHETPFAVIPELVRDYSVEGRVQGEWIELAEVTGNRQRHRRHSFDPVLVDAIRLTILATNGSPWAMVHNIRVWAPSNKRIGGK